MSEVTCEQVVLGWSASNLLGRSGVGPVAASPGWALPLDDPWAGLGRAASYVAGDTGDAPVSLEFRPETQRTLLVAKVPVTGERAGQYQVHALSSEPGALSSWDLVSAVRDGRLFSRPRDVTGRLTTVRLTVAPLRRAAGHDPDVETGLGALLAALAGGTPLLVSSANQEAAVAYVQAVVSMLPPGLQRTVPVSTFVGRADAWPAGIGVVVPGVSEAVAAGIDLDAGTVAGRASTWDEIASTLVTAPIEESRGLASVEDVRAWHALRTTPVGRLDRSQIAGAVAGPLFVTYVSRLAADETGEGLAAVADGPEADAFAARLADAAGEHGDLIATLLARAGERQGFVVSAVGADGMRRSVVRPLVALSQNESVMVWDADLAALLAEAAQGKPHALDGFGFGVTTASWSAVSERLVRQLCAGGPLVRAHLSVVASSPKRVAGLIDRYVGADAAALEEFVEALRRWPDARLPELLECLASCRVTPAVAALKVLSGRPAPTIRRVLAEQWPEIADRLGIPADVAAELLPRHSKWWVR